MSSVRRCVLLLTLLVSASALAAQTETVAPVDRDQTPAAVLEAIDAAREQVAARSDQGSDALARAYGHLGDVMFVHGFSAQAEQAYGNARSLQPQVADWHYLLGLLAMDSGRPDRAMMHFDQAVELNPFDPVAHLRRGQAALEKGELERAAADFDRALALQPEAPAALAGKGRIALEREAYTEAVDWLERALAVAPEATRLHQPLAMAYRGTGDVAQAREHLAQIGEGQEPVDDPLLNRIQAQSRSPQFYLETALQRAAAADFDGARRLLALAIQLAPDDVRVLENYGEVVARQGDLDEAAATFQRWIELAPDQARPHFLLGQVEELRGRMTPARQAYEIALERDPGLVEAAEALAFVRLGMGEYLAAADDFEALAERTGDQYQGRYPYWAALARLGSGQCQRGQTKLETLQERFPTDPDILSALARVRASCGEADQDALEEALLWAEAVYRTAPTADYSAALAMVYAAMGEFDDAVDLQAQAMFEALKTGELEQRADLRADMDRYQSGQPAEQPFSKGFPGFPGPQGE